MPDQPSSLAAALVQLQGRLPHVTKDATGQIQSRTYQYATLPDVQSELFPIMTGLGLAWSCKPMLADGQFVLRYRLVHAPSGEEDTGDWPLPNGMSPQQQGSAVTYFRRYALLAVTGLAPDDDDDGAAAEDAHKTAGPQRLPRTGTDRELAASGRMTRAQKASHERQADDTRASEPADRSNDPADDIWSGPAPEDKPGSATPDQTRRLAIALGKVGIETREDKLTACSSMTDPEREITSSKELSFNEAARIIKWAESEAK